MQAAGLRRPIKSEKLFGLPFGAGLGFLYSVTTISGPPMAVLFNNQGLVKKDFRAGLALIRVGESVLTAIAYWHLGLYVAESQSIFWAILPGVVVGIPLGAYVIRRLDAETFRRVCMSFDVWVVGFGLARVLLELKLAQGAARLRPDDRRRPARRLAALRILLETCISTTKSTSGWLTSGSRSSAARRGASSRASSPRTSSARCG